MRFVSENEQLLVEWDFELNIYHPNEITLGSHKQIFWKCKKGHKWQVGVNSRARGSGCPYCCGKRVSELNSLTEKFPLIAKQFHPTKNEDLLVTQLSVGSHQKCWWIGDCGHEWDAFVKDRTRGVGCPICAGKRIGNDNCLAVVYPHLIKQWHKTKNGSLTPSQVTPKTNKKVWWVCENGHEYFASIHNRTQQILRAGGTVKMGAGCPYCSGNLVSDLNSLAIKAPHLLDEWHPYKNTLLPTEISIGSNRKVWWLGKCGHEWDASVNSRYVGQGCPMCRGSRVCFDNCLATKYPDIAKQWHYSKNDITPFDCVSSSHIKAWWLCDKCGHEWCVTVNNRTNSRSGCPQCKISRGEFRTKSELIRLNVNFAMQYKFVDCKIKRPLPFDFAIFDANENLLGLIEYQGEQHYRPVRMNGVDKKLAIKLHKQVKRSDAIKKKFCNKNKIPLLEIPYNKFDKVEFLLKEFLDQIRCD